MPHPESASGRTEAGRKVRGLQLLPCDHCSSQQAGEAGRRLATALWAVRGPGMGEDQLCRRSCSTFSSFFSMALKPPGRGSQAAVLGTSSMSSGCLLAGVCHFLPLAWSLRPQGQPITIAPNHLSLCLQPAPPCAPLGLAAACSTYDVLTTASDQPSKRRGRLLPGHGLGDECLGK